MLSEEQLSQHLSNSGFYDGCPWDRYFRTLSAAFSNATSNLTLQKGKGGGYLTLNIKYPVDDMMSLTGTLQLSLVDEYCQNEEDAERPSTFKQEVFYSMFEAALSQSQQSQLGQAVMSNTDNDDNRNDSNGVKMEVEQHDDYKSDNVALRRRIALLEEENTRLKAMSQNASSNMRNAFDVGTMDLGASMAVGGGIGGGVLGNKRKRKQRDASKSLMNPRRKKHRTGLQLGGAKKKN